MFDNIYYEDLVYEEYNGLNDSNTESWKEPVNIKGLRLKGSIKVTHSSDGDSTTSSLVFKTKDKLIPKSRIDGREIIDCVPVPGLGINCGYMSYTK